MSSCIGVYDQNKTPCKNKSIEGKRCCDRHQHMENYTPEMMNDLVYRKCCYKWFHKNEHCKSCVLRSAKEIKKKLTETEHHVIGHSLIANNCQPDQSENSGFKVENELTSTLTKQVIPKIKILKKTTSSNDIIISSHKRQRKGIKYKCIGKDRHGNPCRCNAISTTRCCKFHDYMINYTDEMLANLERCSGCVKYYYGLNSGQCQKCHGRGSENRQKERSCREKLPKCIGLVNGRPCQRIGLENGVCGKHAKYVIKTQIESEGFKICSNFTSRGCTEKIHKDSTFKRCTNCREAECNAYKRNKEQVLDFNIKIMSALDNYNNNDDDNMDDLTSRFENFTEFKNKAKIDKFLKCDINGWWCLGCLVYRPIESYIMYDGELKDKCSLCRSYALLSYKKSHPRSKYEIVNSDKIMENCLASVDNSQIDEISISGLTSVENKELQLISGVKLEIETQSQDQQEIEISDNIIINNSDYEVNSKMKEKYNKYIRGAIEKHRDFKLTEKQCYDFFMSSCVYCGFEPRTDSTNGIDRIDSRMGYEFDNCVPCCSSCNFMKGCIDPITFIRRCEHILTFLGQISGQLCYQMFNDRISSSYCEYRNSARRRELSFEITKEEFEQLRKQRCYICGKISVKHLHVNGIDRFDNNRGYISDNCRPCCSHCNFLKCGYDFSDFILRLLNIYHYNAIRALIEDYNNKYQLKSEHIDINFSSQSNQLGSRIPKPTKLNKIDPTLSSKISDISMKSIDFTTQNTNSSQISHTKKILLRLKNMQIEALKG